MTILYCDCFSGISGDMFLSALIDAGLPVEYLAEQFKKIDLPEFQSITTEKVQKGVLVATLLNLAFNDRPEEHDHHGDHRCLTDIIKLIERTGLPDWVQQTSLKVFQMLAEAEAKVHGSSIDEIQFHEVGAADSILDIVGVAVGLHFFDVQAVYASALPLGSGQVKTQHGLLPLPSPATLELLRMAQAPVTGSKATVELVTPTGAAILATLATFAQPDMRLQRVGIGAGQHNLDWPNVLRVLIGTQDGRSDTHLEIEANIDDMNPQLYGYVMTRLFEAGALDVYFTPIYMKKNRPATKLSVIARKEDEYKLCEILLRETSTLGVRVKAVWRHEAQRETRKIMTRFGEISVKIKIIDGKMTQCMPEYDICTRLAKALGVPVAEIIQEVAVLTQELLK